MCDTILQPSSSSDDDMKWKDRSQTINMDVTSIVNALENGQLENLTTKTCDTTHNLLNDIDNFENWLNKTFYPDIMEVKIRNNSSYIMSRLLNLSKHINKMLDNVRKCKPKLKHAYFFQCAKCDKYITTEFGDFLTNIEEHMHLTLFNTQTKNEEEVVEETNEENKIQNEDAVKINEAENEVFETKSMSNVSTNSIIFRSENFPENSSNTTSRDDVSLSTTSSNATILEDNILIKKLYPKRLLSKVFSLQSNRLITVQSFMDNGYRCLICKRDIHDFQSIIRHIMQPQHYNVMSVPSTREKLNAYHALFSKSSFLSVHQVCFLPGYTVKDFRCKVCAAYVPNVDLAQHIRGAKHMSTLYEGKTFKKYHFYQEIISSLSNKHLNHPNVFKAVEKSKMNSKKPKPKTISSVPINQIQDTNGNKEKTEEGLKNLLNLNKEELLAIKDTLLTLEQSNTPNQNKVKQTGKKKTESKNDASKSNVSKSAKSPLPKQHKVLLSIKGRPENIFDTLEHRLREHNKIIFMEPFFKEELECLKCNVMFEATTECLKQHIISNEHLKASRKDISRKKWSYYCDLCYKDEYNELKWFEHLKGVAHMQRWNAVAEQTLKGGRFKEYQCEECLVVFFGNGITIARHERLPVSKSKKKKKEYKISAALEKFLRDHKTVEEKIAKLSNESEKMLDLYDLHLQCCKAIEEALKSVYPVCEASPFGSRVSGIGHLNSDLDVFVDTGMMYDGSIYQDAESQATIVKQVTKILTKHQDFSHVNPIPQARTPIVQVFHKITEIDCDLSFRHGLSVVNTDFLRLCIDIQPVLKPFILILKYWSQQCTFDRMSTYAFSMMAIFYMQVKNYLPSLKMIRKLDPTPSRVIAGWRTFSFTKPLELITERVDKCTLSAKELLIDFFKYYIDFKFEKDVICPLLGHTILKSDFDENSGLNLPEEMDNYVQKIKEDKNSERFRYMSPMCIQDPFDLSHNLTKACHPDYVTRFIALCQICYDILVSK